MRIPLRGRVAACAWLGVAVCLPLVTWALVRGAENQASAPGRVVRGVVFEDTNANGLRDVGERGLPRVGVSDQVTFVVTAEDGSYRLETSSSSGVVFVRAPDGWAPASGFWRPLSDAPGEHPVDFALRSRARESEFAFVHASDLHLSESSLPRLRLLREAVERLRPALVLITGDLVRDALRVPETEARGYYELLVSELALFSAPVWTVPGNHDLFGVERHLSLVSPQHPLYGKRMYRHYLGPNYYSFTCNGVHFIGLDTADVDDLWYYGHIDATQLEWVKRDLASLPPGTPVVTFNHIPLLTAVEALAGYREEPPAPSLIRVAGTTSYRHVVSNTSALLELIKNFHLELALGGHMHARESLTYEVRGKRMRFHQAAAIAGPSDPAGLTMLSGFTVYRVRDGKVDDGAFVPLP